MHKHLHGRIYASGSQTHYAPVGVDFRERHWLSPKAIVCVFVGHRWREAADVYEAFPVLECKRCGRKQTRGSDTQGPEGWFEREGRKTRASELQDARIQRRP
jgi:hypothetical protein